MAYDIAAGPLTGAFPYAEAINRAGVETGVSPLVLGAIAWRETLGSAAWLMSVYGQPPATVVSHDGGHGIFQLTSSYPAGWTDPYESAKWAAVNYIIPAIAAFAAVPYSFTGSTLVRCVGAAYNAGLQTVEQWHNEYGDVDKYTTRADGIPYGIGVENNYIRLSKGLLPNPT